MLEDLDRRILYRDADLLILDKPAGIAVHASRGAGPTLEAILPLLRFGADEGPFLTHRLDRDTTGCLVLARTRQALRLVNAAFAAGDVRKTYWAVVEPPPAGEGGEVDLPVLKVRRQGGWAYIGDRKGEAAVTCLARPGRGRGDGLA